MTIRRSPHHKENSYVAINKKCLEDCNLSWKAKGVLVHLISQKEDDEDIFYLEDRVELTKIVEELIEHGYCSWEQDGFVLTSKIHMAGK